MEYGVLKGEQCNRDGCTGIIDEHEKEGGCCCYICPPCSYCTTDTAYCPECGWDCNDDNKTIDPVIAKRNHDYYAKMMEDYNVAEENFNSIFNGKTIATELQIRSYSHTNSSMLVKGVFPVGSETSETILPKVRGTFGGRFTKFDKERGIFEYIAYTD